MTGCGQFPRATYAASALLGAGAGEGLARLDLDLLALVPDALALVRLGLADDADLGGEVADGLLVRADDHDPVGDVALAGLDGDGDVRRGRDRDRVGEAE